MPIIDVTPEKRVYLSVISEYDMKRSVCELIDNAIDLWKKNNRSNLEIKLTLDDSRQSISIEDNAGGVEKSELGLLLSPGKTTNDVSDNVIGYFGVGVKRAVVALAQDITIKTRYGTSETCVIHFDDEWINEDPHWRLSYNVSQTNLSTDTTLIELFKLRVPFTKKDEDNLKVHLSEVYGMFILEGIKIIVNGATLKAITFDKSWTFPKKYAPKCFSNKIIVNDRTVNVEIISGLIDHPGDSDNSYGVFFYCNNRLIVRGLVDYDIGFESGKIGIPHYNISLARTIIKLTGQSRDMPWNSSKSNIDAKHPVFQALRLSIINVTANYAKVSRALQGKWDEEVFPFKKGKIILEKSIDITNIPRNHFPAPPASKPRWQQRVIKINESITSQKPWATGLQDSIIAADLVSNLALSHKNRISLIVLDSTLEIAYKEYLINEQGIGLNAFKKIAENRSEIQKEVFKTIKVLSADEKKINHYYRLRCDLIHQRATPNVSNSDIYDYRKIVEDLLHKMFGLQFNV
jgi:hypothetical protein